MIRVGVMVLALIGHWADLHYLVHAAHVRGVDAKTVLAIAWVESGTNLNPRLRGHHCWFSIRIDSENVLVHHELDCEVGRFQIKPSTASARCKGLNVWTYRGNVACFLKMFKQDTERYGLRGAIKRQNGSGLMAERYVERVLRIRRGIGRLE